MAPASNSPTFWRFFTLSKVRHSTCYVQASLRDSLCHWMRKPPRMDESH
jgi:hypothetical protein